MDNIASILSNLPSNFFQGDDHLENMSKFSTYVQASEAVNEPPPSDPTVEVAESDLDKFGNWTGQTDTLVMARDLMKRGLVGAEQLLYSGVDTSSPNKIRGSQPTWKTGLIMNILVNAKKKNIRTKEEVLANKDYLSGKWKDAVNDPIFSQIHPNFWNIITESILPEQYAKFDKQNNSQTASK